MARLSRHNLLNRAFGISAVSDANSGVFYRHRSDGRFDPYLKAALVRRIRLCLI